MESSVATSPTIDQSMQCLKDHLLSCADQGILAHSAVKVYVSSMHLLCAIKEEQLYIAEFRYVINIRVFQRLIFPNRKIFMFIVMYFLLSYDDGSKRFQKYDQGKVQKIPFLSHNKIPTVHKILQ